MNIVLIGFMGAGKTVIGKNLAKRLHFSFLDMDQVIETEQGMAITSIFRQYGELYFRKLEKEKAKALAQEKNAVIATGGGIVLDAVNMTHLRKRGLIIYLKASENTLKHRLQNQRAQRPLLREKNWTEKFASLYGYRYNLYESFAQYVVETDHKSIDEVSSAIFEFYLNYKNSTGEN